MTSVPFDHVSPAAMYAHNVDRDDYQDLARDMLGLPGIIQQARQGAAPPGPRRRHRHRLRDHQPAAKTLAAQGKNGVPGNLYITDADLAAIDVKNGGKYVVVQTEPGVDGGRALPQAADRGGRAVRAPVRLLRPRRGSTTSPTGPPTAATTPRPASAAGKRRGESTPRPTASSSRPSPT